MGGGFLFAMCSAADSYDIALAADGVDICDAIYDGDGADPRAQQKLDFTKCFAFRDFTLVRNPLEYEYSNIDMSDMHRNVPEDRTCLCCSIFRPNGIWFLPCFARIIPAW